MPCMPRAGDLRAADHRLGHLHAAGADVEVALVDLRLVDARRHAGRELAAQPAAAARPPRPRRARPRARAASSPDLTLTSRRRSCGRPIQICLGGRTRIVDVAVSPGAISAPGGLNVEAAVVVGLARVEGDVDRRVGLVLDGDLEVGLAAAGRALGLDLGLVLLEGLDAEQQRRGGGRDLGAPWSARRPAAPRSAPRPRRRAAGGSGSPPPARRCRPSRRGRGRRCPGRTEYHSSGSPSTCSW